MNVNRLLFTHLLFIVSVANCSLPVVGPPSQNGGHAQTENLNAYQGTTITSSQNKKYQLLSHLGEGRYGVVFEASILTDADQESDLIAVKISYSDEHSIQNTEKEFKVDQYIRRHLQVDQPVLYKFFDSFSFQGHTCLVTERLGQSIIDILSRRPFRNGFSFHFIQSVLRSLLTTLAIFHRMDLIHGDVKPDNILRAISNPDQFKLIDYSLVSHCQNVQCHQALYYTSPEVLFHIACTNKIDIWALGCVTAELFFGIPIFPANSEKELAYFFNLLIGPLPQPLCKKSPKKYFFNKEGQLKKLSELNFGADPQKLIAAEHPFFVYNSLEDNWLAYREIPTEEYVYQVSNNFDGDGNPIHRDLLTIDLSQEEIENRFLLLDMVRKMLDINYEVRPEAEDLLNHPFMLAHFEPKDSDN